jgi:hypothetical protein
MTSDEFGSRYRLLKQITGDGVRSFTAEHKNSHRAVLIHFLDPGSSLAGDGLADLLGVLSARDRSRVLEVTTVDQSTVVVTEVLEGFQTLEGWLRSHAVQHPPRATLETPPPAQGDFTQLFRSEPEVAPPRPPASQPRPAEPQPPAGGGATPRDAGGFTELFRTSEPPASSKPLEDPAVPPVPLVSVRVKPLPQPEPPPRWPDAGPGTTSTPDPKAPFATPVPGSPFTSPELKSPFSSPEPKAPFANPEPRPPILTPKFGNEQRPAPARPAPAPAPDLGRMKLDASDAPAANAPAPSVWAGPSDFTRQLSRSPEAGFPEQPPIVPAPTLPEPQPQGKSILVPVLLALNLIFIVITGLVVYFALRRS